MRYNHGKNIMKQCDILVYVSGKVASSKVGPDFYQNKLCIRVASRVAERL